MQITKANVAGAFKRLHKEMGWPDMAPVKDGKPNPGAISLVETGYYGWSIEQIINKNGGVKTLFGMPSWPTKRQAWETMIAMAQAIEHYKRQQVELATAADLESCSNEELEAAGAVYDRTIGQGLEP